jgi:tetratricopeptide (TPR) repeat protein
MNNNSTNTELLTKYLDGELQGEQLIRLEIRIKEDNNLQQELDNLKISLEAVKTYGLHQKVSSIHSAMMKEFNMQPLHYTGRTHKFIKYTLRVAATVIIILGGMLLYQYITLSSQSLFQNNFEAYSLHENRGIENGSALEQQYKLGNYPAVIESFRLLQTRTIQDYFIAGNAYLRQNNSLEAIKSFLSVQEMNKVQQTHQYEDDTEYYLAMSYLQHNETAKALPLFEKINADKNHLYHNKMNAWFLRKLHWLQHKS